MTYLLLLRPQGWTNPPIGSYEAGVVESSNPTGGYNAADDDGGYIQSKYTFVGKGKHQQTVILTVANCNKHTDTVVTYSANGTL